MMLTDNTVAERPPLIAEIIGPAGAGKTTLSRALSQRNKKIVVGVRLCRIRYIPFFVSNTLFFLPTFLRQYRNSRWFTWAETRSMMYLKAWHHVLGRQTLNNGMVTVLDHGPIFRLALLREFGPEITTGQLYERWWDSTLNQWAATLDMLIWLDAPDAILMERIHARNERHKVREKSEQEAYEFLARYRTSYEQIISMLATGGGPRVLRFDTDQESVSQIVDQVLVAFDPEHSEG